MAGERGNIVMDGTLISMRFSFIPLWDVDLVWPQAAPMLAKALALQESFSIESVYRGVKDGKFHLWLGDNVALITEIQQFPLERICMVVLCGGRAMESWEEIIDATITRYARTMGCAAMMIVGRRGWSKVYPEFHIDGYVMRKSLEHKS